MERRQAVWLSLPHKKDRVCSACGHDEPYKNADYYEDIFSFCPFCGAEMGKTGQNRKNEPGMLPMRIIEKKILPKYFEEVSRGTKNFELRKDEDNAQPGDVLFLREYEPGEGYTGRSVTRIVTYVLRDCPEYGLIDGYCIISMRPPVQHQLRRVLRSKEVMILE